MSVFRGEPESKLEIRKLKIALAQLTPFGLEKSGVRNQKSESKLAARNVTVGPSVTEYRKVIRHVYPFTRNPSLMFVLSYRCSGGWELRGKWWPWKSLAQS